MRVYQKAFRLSLFCLIVFSASNYSYAKEWRGIRPLHSNRADVERLIGPPATPGGSTYHLEKEDAFIGYSKGPCIGSGSWNVPKDIVLYVSVSPKTKPLLMDLHLDLSEYEKEQDPHMADRKYYVDEKNGERLEVNEPEKLVYSFVYYPKIEDQNLSCPDSQFKGEIVDKGMKVGEFSDYWAESTQEILDGIAAKLKSDPDSKGYIVFPSQGDQTVRTKLFAELAKSYLTEKRGIRSERIILKMGAVSEKDTVEIWFSPVRF